jgi:DnaJ-domain-containing protein 1
MKIHDIGFTRQELMMCWNAIDEYIKKHEYSDINNEFGFDEYHFLREKIERMLTEEVVE